MRFFVDDLGLIAQLECTTCIAWSTHYLTGLAQHIDERRNTWGESRLEHWRTVGGMQTSLKRPRQDSHIVEVARSTAASSSRGVGKVLHAQSLLKGSTLVGWQDKYLCAVIAQQRLQCNRDVVRVYSSAFDASRIGNPSLDLLAHLVMSPTSRTVHVLPPTVTTTRNI
eukprot:6476327-Amphidinium_carterae.1